MADIFRAHPIFIKQEHNLFAIRLSLHFCKHNCAHTQKKIKNFQSS